MSEYKIFGSHILKVEISSEVWKIWNKYRQTNLFKREACGVLIGGFDQKNKTIVIEKCTEPMKADIRHRSSFTLRDGGHQKTVDKAFEQSAGRFFYLGTWHTHPDAYPSPSFIDEEDWRDCMARNFEIPCFLFAIVGTKSVSLFPKGRILNYEFQTVESISQNI